MFEKKCLFHLWLYIVIKGKLHHYFWLSDQTKRRTRCSCQCLVIVLLLVTLFWESSTKKETQLHVSDGNTMYSFVTVIKESWHDNKSDCWTMKWWYASSKEEENRWLTFRIQRERRCGHCFSTLSSMSLFIYKHIYTLSKPFA